MRTILTSIAAGGLLAALAAAQPLPRYTVTDLGTLPGGHSSQVGNVSDNGIVSGSAAVADGSQHAVLWYQGRTIDISKPGLLGPNSFAVSVNNRGQAAGLTERLEKDPNNENFCAYGTGLKCQPLFWQGGVMTLLPLLGTGAAIGNNGAAIAINNQGEVAGIAENSTRDPECPPGVSDFSGTGPQVLDYEAVIWGPSRGQIRVLRPLSGDTVGMALSINDLGQVVGASGRCGNTNLPGIAYAPHAVLWEKDGTPTDLGNLGGAVANAALAINNQGQVTGSSSPTADSTPFDGNHAFLWTRETGKMRDLGTLARTDVNSAGLGINDRGDVIGASADADGNTRAFLWRNGVMTDLNNLVSGNAQLYLTFAFWINSAGQIVGSGCTVNKAGVCDENSEVHGFLATPSNGNAASESDAPAAHAETSPMVLPENVRQMLRQRMPYGRFGGRLIFPR